MKRWMVVATVVAGMAAAGTAREQRPKADPPPNFMRRKLQDTQAVLNGLAVKDFGMIEASSEALILLSAKAEFQLLKTPEYRRYADDFRRDAEALSRAAKQKNLDEAALAYVQLTLNCVNCHKHVRDVRK